MFFFVFIVFLDVNVFKMNLKFGFMCGVGLFKLILKLNNCMLLIVIFLLNKGIILNLVERCVILSIFFFDWLLSNILFIMIWFNNLMFILLIVSFVFKVWDSFFVINVVIFCWIYGIFSKIIVLIYIFNMILII